MRLTQLANHRAWLLFLMFFALYLSLSPLSMSGMGYAREQADAAAAIIGNLIHLVSPGHPPAMFSMPRHGVLEPFFELPFVGTGMALGGLWQVLLLSLEPILATSALCTVLFLWARRVCGNDLWPFLLAIGAAFTTELFPYAYIGMETTQGVFVILAGYLALGADRRRPRLAAFLFALVCGLAVGVKADGVFLVPAVAFLILIYYRRAQSAQTGEHLAMGLYLRKTGVLALLPLALFSLAYYSRAQFAPFRSGQSAVFRAYLVAPGAFFLNAFSFFGSANKGLIIYCPLTLLCLVSLKRAYSEDKATVIFAVLVLAGLVLGFSSLEFWTDETWGPRYLHSAIAPLFVCLALAKKNVRFRLRSEVPALVLAVWGLFVSALGVAFYYGSLHFAAKQSSQGYLDLIQDDLRWNPIRFNFELAKVLLHPGKEAHQWPPPMTEWSSYVPIAHPIQIVPVDLKQYAYPQPFLLKKWRHWYTVRDVILWTFTLCCLMLGLFAFVRVGRLCAKEPVRLGAQVCPPGSVQDY